MLGALSGNTCNLSKAVTVLEEDWGGGVVATLHYLAFQLSNLSFPSYREQPLDKTKPVPVTPTVSVLLKAMGPSRTGDCSIIMGEHVSGFSV